MEERVNLNGSSEEWSIILQKMKEIIEVAIHKLLFSHV